MQYKERQGVNNSMKRITFLVGSLGGGGAERVTVALGDCFVKKGYEIFFIVFSRENNNYEINSKIHIDFLPENLNSKKIYIDRICELKRLLKKQLPDYVISLGLGHQYLILGNLLNKYKFILSERNAPQYFYKWYERIYVKYSYKKAYRVVFQTKDAQAYYGKSIEYKSKVIANPITSYIPESYEGVREKRIVAVNRLSQQKNIFMLFRAFKRVLEKYPEYTLEIYGKGEQEDELKKYAGELKIDKNVVFMGQKANVHSYIINASMFVSSSDFEGMSNSMLEAMAIGLPVVCTDCPIGGAKMVIKNNLNGLLTPVGDDEEFAKAIIYLIEHPDKAGEMGKRASKLREELKPDIIAEQWEKLLTW